MATAALHLAECKTNGHTCFFQLPRYEMAPSKIHPDPEKATALQLCDGLSRIEATIEENTIVRKPFQVPEHGRMRDCLLKPPPTLNWHRAGRPPASPGLSWSWFTLHEPDFRSYYLMQRSKEECRTPSGIRRR
jgi:hypothetical protein